MRPSKIKVTKVRVRADLMKAHLAPNSMLNPVYRPRVPTWTDSSRRLICFS